MLSSTVPSEMPRVAAVCEHQDRFEFPGLVMHASMTGRPVSVTAEDKSVSCSSDCWSKPVTANMKGSNRTSLQLKGGTCYIFWISLLHSKIGSYPSQSDHRLKAEILCTILK
jgi:hypothetical protein